MLCGRAFNGYSYQYDAAGDVTQDPLNAYLYDAEGRVCAVKNSTGAITGYIYGAAGVRVAKGTLTSFSCNFAPSNFQTTASWVLGPGGEQATEYAVSGGTSTWAHSNVFAGQLLATYNGTDTVFDLNDWLGTKRAEIGASGCFSSFTSMAFGDGLSPGTSSNPCADASEHHFTGKEHDAESGNDYFGARYYASSMGRWLSPDPKLLTARHLINPQKWNKYAYVLNSPLLRFDPDGMDDYVVFRTVTAGTNRAQWVAAERSIKSQLDSKGRLNTFHMVEGDAATIGAWRKALNTPDTHVVFVGHSGEDMTDPHHPIALSVNLTNGAHSMGRNGSEEMIMSSRPSNTPGAPPELTLSVSNTLSDAISASSVALFSCNSFDLRSQYTGVDFTGVQSGPFTTGTELETLDQMAADWVSAGGGQDGLAAANWTLGLSTYPIGHSW